MNAGLPDDISVREGEPGGVCYVLPAGWGRRGWTGPGEVALGLFFWGMAVTFLLVSGARAGWSPLAVYLAGQGVLPACVGCWLVYDGLKRATRPLGIVLAPGWLGVIYGLGPFQFRRERPLRNVLRLWAYSPAPGPDGKLVAVCRNARDMSLAWGAPRERLLELARFLEEQIAHLCRDRAGDAPGRAEGEEDAESI